MSQQYNVVTCVCLCVELYASKNACSAYNPGKTTARFPHLAQFLFLFVFQINFGVRQGSLPLCLRFMLTMRLAVVKKNVIYI